MKRIFLLTVLLYCTIQLSKAQILRYSFTGATGTPVTYAPDAQPMNGIASDMGRGAGIVAASATDAFSANNWTLTAGIDLTDYYTFTITPNGGYRLNITRLELDEVRSLTGIRTWSVRSSVDAFATDLTVFNVPDDANTRTVQTINLGASFNNVSTAIEFRIYGYASEANTGSWRIDNVKVFGNISLPDVMPPTLTSITPISATQIDVLFSESIDNTTASQTANYSVNNGIGTPSVAVRDGSNLALVHLTFVNSFSNGQNYILTASNIKDLVGNTLTSANQNFLFYTLSNAAFNDLVITEIMADPTPIIGLPDAEYVEIFNRSNKYINLKNYTLNAKTVINTDFVIAPNDYVLFCPTLNVSSFSGKVIGVVAGFDGLTNTGETITLTDATNSLIIDAVAYTDDWYKNTAKKDGGYSLEIINPFFICSGENNWKVSESLQGGTPAQQNAVYDATPDTTPPILNQIKILANNRILLIFNEVMNSSSLSNPVNYTFPNLTVNNVVTGQSSVEITINEILTAGNVYQITISNLKDCAGNNLPTANSANIFSFGSGIAPTNANDLVISEIFADPDPTKGLPEYEFLEIYNRTNKIISLKDCQLIDASSKAKLPDYNLLPQDYVIITSTTGILQYQTYQKALGVTSFPSLSNTGELISLKNASAKLIFSVFYSDDWYANATKKDGGYSLEMVDTNNPCGEANNWKASENPQGGTPGKQNSVKSTNPDNFPPKLLRANAITNQSVVLYFDEKLDSLSLNTTNFTFSPALSPTTKLLGTDGKQVSLTFTPSLEARRIYTVSVANLRDCNGNAITTSNSAFFALPEEDDSLDIVLNEVLFNAKTNGVDFVELYNRSEKFINLRNWKLGRIYNNQVDDTLKITTDNYVLAPQTYVALATDTANIQSFYPKSVGKPFLKIASMPTYADDEGTVLLYNNKNKLVERFDYSDKYHFELLSDKNGVSLERLGFDLPTNDRNSWFSAASTEGFATPGYQNSQRKLAGGNLGTLSIEPRVITPDNDGQADFATIRYKFNTNGNVANISIYDSHGRKVKQLAQSLLLSNEGDIRWDGSTDIPNQARVGYYVVLFEVFDGQGNQQVLKETVAVTER